MNSLADLISRAEREFAEREAIVGERRTLRFSDVEEESNRLASALARGLGLGKGERVAILLPNCPEFVVTDFALIKAGLIRVPVNPRYVAPEIEFILEHSGAAALVTSAAFAGVVAQLQSEALLASARGRRRSFAGRFRLASLERRATPGGASRHSPSTRRATTAT